MTPVKLMMQGQASTAGTPAPSSSAHSSQQLTDAARSHRDALLAPPLSTPVLQPGCLIDVALAGRLYMGAGFPQTTRASITRILNEQSFEVCVCARAHACVHVSVSRGVLCIHERTHICVQRPRRQSARGSWAPRSSTASLPAQLRLALSQVHSPEVHPGWTTALFITEENHLWKRVGECAARHCVCVHLCAGACGCICMSKSSASRLLPFCCFADSALIIVAPPWRVSVPRVPAAVMPQMPQHSARKRCVCTVFVCVCVCVVASSKKMTVYASVM